MFGKPFRLHPKGKLYVVTYGDSVLAKISKSGLETLLADLRSDEGLRLQGVLKKSERSNRSKITKPRMVGEDVIKAKQFAKVYAEAKKKFYKSKFVKEISQGEKAFQDFVKVIPMLERHGVNYRKFIQAQVQGLSFANGGRGVFPKPGQLSTEGAETRLLDFMRDGGQEDGSKAMVHLTKEDRETPLSDNQWFMARRQKLKDGVASLEEAQYVAELQRIRRGKVEDYVQEYIDRLTGGE